MNSLSPPAPAPHWPGPGGAPRRNPVEACPRDRNPPPVQQGAGLIPLTLSPPAAVTSAKSSRGVLCCALEMREPHAPRTPPRRGRA
eukprot:scaffold1295_cov188-Prasinococcus_capsulatus_cf.AAC.1